MKILRIRLVCELTGLGRSTIYKLMHDGEFPKQKKISFRSVGWLEEDVRSWIESKVRV